MRRFALILSLLLTALPLFAQWQSLGKLESYSRDGESAVMLRSGNAALSVRVISDQIVRVRLAPNGAFARDHSWAVVPAEWAAVHPRLDDAPDAITLSTRTLRVVISKNPIRLSFFDSTGQIINQDHPGKGMSWAGKETRTWKVMPSTEHYYGFGEKAGRFERGQTHMTMWNSDIPAYAADTDPLYETIPFFYGISKGRAYGIFMDNPYRSSFDMGKESRDQYSFGAEDGEMNYYFIYGPDPQGITERFTQLVGRMPLPPRWSLGYQQSRWSYAPESRVREIARGFRERSMPCDVLYLDIDYMDGYRIFTWNQKNFPDPARMISDLSKDGFRMAVIVDPGIKVDSTYSAFQTGLSGNQFVKYPDGRVFTGKVWPGVCAFPDFTNQSARQWWGSQFAGLAAAGIRGWWNDMNEPSVFDVPSKTMDPEVLHDNDGSPVAHAGAHNIYGMQMTRGTYEGIRKLLPAERPFILTRATYAGGQRYSAAWTGDNVSSWDHLRMALSMCLNLSISGQPFVGSDIGGFIGYPSGELFARWLQLGVFTPLMRAHSVINEKNKEPWEYGAEFTAINRETLNLRYRLLPYIYTAMREASTSGVPPMRPLVYAYPESDRYWGEETTFMFGNDLLVAPILWEGSREREIVPPEGTWYDYWSGKRIQGGATVKLDGSLGRIPILVKAGATIPQQQIVQYTDQAPINPLTLYAAPPEAGVKITSSYYEDDGLSFAYEQQKYFARTFSQLRKGAELEFSASACEGTYLPPPRTVEAQFVVPMPSRVQFNGAVVSAGTKLSAENPSWSYDKNKQVLTVTYPETRKAYRILMQF